MGMTIRLVEAQAQARNRSRKKKKIRILLQLHVSINKFKGLTKIESIKFCKKMIQFFDLNHPVVDDNLKSSGNDLSIFYLVIAEFSWRWTKSQELLAWRMSEISWRYKTLAVSSQSFLACVELFEVCLVLYGIILWKKKWTAKDGVVWYIDELMDGIFYI